MWIISACTCNIHLNSGNPFSDDLQIWKDLFLKGLTFRTYGRCIYGVTHRKISICFTGVSLTWATWIGHPTSDPPWSLNPQGWLVSNLRKANGTICPSDILFTISWQNSQTFSSHCMNRALPSDSFYGNLSYYCYRKLVSVSVDGRRKYLIYSPPATHVCMKRRD